MAFSKKCLRIDLQSYVILLCLIWLMIANGHVDGRICNEIDVRNDPSQLLKLRNCTIVLGSVQIVLIERIRSVVDFNSYSFPELREITGYLLFFRVFGLKSLSNLFPNLAVIRGERLRSHYALIIYEMTDLTEIGLVSLIKIQRGYVMIRYCPVLCYVHTIDWEAITQIPIGNGLGNYVDQESSSSACPTSKSCPDICHRKNCWNNKKCQLFDDIDRIKNCHKECIGGCTNVTHMDCNICRNFYSLEDGICVRECPYNQYALSSLCVDATYCKKHGKKPIYGECRDSCPPIIAEKNVNISSIDQCARECPGIEVDSLATSDLFRGCQIVRGDIYIRLQSGVADTMQILTRNLGDIEEIGGILKVYRSPVITSLSFLRNLRIIRGSPNYTENTKYTFVIMSNENLQEFWDFNEKKTLNLVRGNLQIHYNSKLCLNQIHALQKILKTNTTEDFISPESNGYEQTCSAREIVTWYHVIDPSSAKISWKKITVSDSEKIMGYIIFYIEAPEKTVTHLGIDTCVQYGWQTIFIQNPSTNETSSSHSIILGNLTQNTQYAYYVKTQVVPKEHEEETLSISQGQSNIEYFKTKADQPNYPSVETMAKTNTSLTLMWSPTFDNELIEYYKMDMFKQPDEHEFLDSRNYCDNPRVDVHVSVGVEVNENPSSVYQSCSAEFENWKILNPDAVDPEYQWRMYRKSMCAQRFSHRYNSQIMNYVQNNKIRDCSDKKCVEKNDFESFRFSRQISNLLTTNDFSDFNDFDDFNNEGEKPNLGPNHIYSKSFSNITLNDTFTNLLPYTLYIFQFFACNYVSCSSYYLHYDRTDSSIYADEISLKASIDPNDSNQVHLYFDEPKTPNGLTVAFQIEKHSLNDFKVSTICITRKEHYDNGKKYTFDHLDKGQYSFRVRSISLAMTGPYTAYIFISVYDQSYSTASIVGIVFLCLFILTLFGAALYFYRQKRRPYRMRSLNASTQNILFQMEEVDLDPMQEDDIPPFYHANSNHEFSQ